MVPKVDINKTKIVTVLTPPAVPTGEPPINIIKMDTRAEPLEKFS